MNEFKILSIDEFDTLFVKDLRIKKAEPQKTDSGLIPEIIKTDDPIHADKKITVSDSVADVDNPIVSENNSDIGSEDGFSSELSDGNNEENSFPDFFEKDIAADDNKKITKKSSSGNLTGKIVSIVMLSITVVIFILGCFVSVFLDNSGLDIGGICFSTQSRDIQVGNDKIGEGALIISKKILPDEYSEHINKPVAVRADKNASNGCDIMFLYSATESYGSITELKVYDPMTNEISNNTYISSECIGIVQRYVPFVGGILTFAIRNVVLVCALFVLLAAFWCLLLTLFEKNSKRN